MGSCLDRFRLLLRSRNRGFLPLEDSGFQSLHQHRFVVRGRRLNWTANLRYFALAIHPLDLSRMTHPQHQTTRHCQSLAGVPDLLGTVALAALTIVLRARGCEVRHRLQASRQGID